MMGSIYLLAKYMKQDNLGHGNYLIILIFILLISFGVDGAISTTFIIDFLLVRTSLKKKKKENIY